VIDADGHITETTDQLRPYFEGRHGERGHWAGRRSYYPEDGWDRSLGGQLGSKANDAKTWLDILDQGGMEAAVLYPTAGLGIGWVREPDFAVALCRAYNNFLREEFLAVSPRLQGVALLPFQDVPEAVTELRRAVGELGMVGAFAPAVGLRLPLGHPQFHPIYAEAERLGAMVACHATVRGPQYFGAEVFDKFIEVHTLSHPVAQMIQLTGMIFEGVPAKYPGLRIGFMEAGCSWVPFWMDRMDEEWEKRGAVEAPLCAKKPSEYLRSGRLYFAAEGDEQSVPEVVRRLGDGIVFYASDVPHWDHDFPKNIHELSTREDLSPETRRKILYDNTRRLYELPPSGPAGRS
jgi:predicted TIM-barrel fold metal-dependent hydrolase